MEKRRASMSQQPPETPQEEISLSTSNDTEMSIYDIPLPPAKKIRTNISQQPRETTRDSSLVPSKQETELILFDVSMTPPVKNVKATMRQEPRETTDQDSSFSLSMETGLLLFGVSMTPPGNKNQTNMWQEPRESPQDQMPLTGVPTSPAKSLSQNPRDIPNEYLFLPSKEVEMEMSLSSASPMDTDEDLKKKKTNCLDEDPKKGIVSTAFCLRDETWPCGNREYPKVTCAPRDDESTKQQEARNVKEMEMSLSSASPMDTDEDLKKKKTNRLDEDPKKGIVSTAFCLRDETWPCGNREYPKVTCAPREDESTEQQEARNVKEIVFLSKEQREPEERYRLIDPWVIQKKLTKTDVCNRINLSVYGVERHILRYLFKYEQNRVLEGPGIMINVYDDDTHTTHKLRLRKWNFNKTCCLTDRWRTDFVNRRSLKVGDEIGLFWDRFHSTLHFRVLSSAMPKASAEEKK